MVSLLFCHPFSETIPWHRSPVRLTSPKGVCRLDEKIRCTDMAWESEQAPYPAAVSMTLLAPTIVAKGS
ncbi:MAG TPA: hypothetical protein IGS52_05770 [Oscillatoriaceae cyanobacterium M33_DOE_052]|uniref:Uncharacterized protein n=1 Tax=Planktothricoides sp. SpSt-374 TaxID=2282167 RepID=A0A7C3ZHL3_9CYAN|nr:hypothetical protein [Oscillatoriaceae cyanobacterium M33_DOE_052]